MMNNSIMVFSEDSELQLQLLGKGKDLANKIGGNLSTIIIEGSDKETNVLLEHCADKIYFFDKPRMSYFDTEYHRSALLKAIEIDKPEIVLVGATKMGKELAARVAAVLETGCMTECIELDVEEQGKLHAKRLRNSGSTISTEVSHLRPHIATVAPRTFDKAEPVSKVGEIIKLDIDIPKPPLKVIDVKEKLKRDMGLEDSPIIVSAGRGFKDKYDLKLLQELAEVLDAKIGCSRPIAADLGWMDEWIGISGHKVKPKLYIACGISGTIQHAAGIRGSQLIVSINDNESSNIIELSDYAIIGDIYKVIPALTKTLKEKIT